MNFSKGLIIFFWIVVGYLVLQFYNPLRVNSTINTYNRAADFFPQGWGFFTRNPQEELIEAFEFSEGKLIPIASSAFDKSNLYGISKNVRQNLKDIGALQESVKNKKWRSSKGPLPLHAASQLKADTLKVRDSKTFGENFKIIKRGHTYMLRKYKTVPFAWSNDHQEQYNNYETIKVFIK